MLKSTSVLTLLLALGVLSAGAVATSFGPFSSAAAYADGDNESHSGIEDDDGFDGGHKIVSDDDSNDDNAESDDNKAVGATIGPVFNEGSAPTSKCKDIACKVN
jgi:hypothetical protein